MREFIDPLLNFYPGRKWLTVGDGRYGTDAHYLLERGANVLATDISTALLQVGKETGFINEYKRENAEKLNIKDESYDFVFCKESFHHFPRPMIALYEMLRVAKNAVILIEPHDSASPIESLAVRLLRKASTLSFNTGYFNSFEESGNYVYKVSEREIEKAAVALQLPALAFAGLDDFYISGVEYEKPNLESPVFLKTKLALFILNILYKLGIRKRSIIVTIIFKERPPKTLRRELIKRGLKVFDLPKNPYL